MQPVIPGFSSSSEENESLFAWGICYLQLESSENYGHPDNFVSTTHQLRLRRVLQMILWLSKQNSNDVHMLTYRCSSVLNLVGCWCSLLPDLLNCRLQHYSMDGVT